MPTYHFDSYEGGKPKWTPGVDNQRQYDDYKDNRREHRRPRKDRDAYEDPPPPAAAAAPPRGKSTPPAKLHNTNPTRCATAQTPPQKILLLILRLRLRLAPTTPLFPAR
jgi:hypothetical protein